MARKTTVAVIGAGLAGLTAAYELLKRNFDVQIFEATDQIGGRVSTLRQFQHPNLFAEAGAMIFTDAEPKLIALANELEVKVLSRPEFSRKRFHSNGELGLDDPSVTVMTILMNEIQHLEKNIIDKPQDWSTKQHTHLEKLDSINIIDFIIEKGIDPVNTAKILSSTLIGIYADNLQDLSALDALRFLSQYAHCTKMHSIKGGNDRLPLALAAKLNSKKQSVLLNKPVSRVAIFEDNCRIEFSNGDETRQFDFVVLATPLSSLQSHNDQSIKLPDLPTDQAQALDAIAYNTSVARVYCEVNKRFWTNQFDTATVTTDQMTLWIEDHTSAQQNSHAVLEAHTGCDVGRQILASQKPNDIGVQLIARVYGELFKQHLQPETTTTIRWDDSMPYQKGGNCYLKPNQRKLLTTFTTPIRDKIFFAGEYTTLHKPFSMNGAMLSGYRVVDELTTALELRTSEKVLV